jgi:uncharacterized membrane protein YhaH (DUF805 family)
MGSVLSHFSNCWKKSFDFKGRSTRAEYWSFVLTNAFLGLALLILLSSIKEELGVIVVVYFAASLIPYASAIVRRVRDTGMSYWLLILGIIPYIGQFFVFGLLLMPSTKKK